MAGVYKGLGACSGGADLLQVCCIRRSQLEEMSCHCSKASPLKVLLNSVCCPY